MADNFINKINVNNEDYFLSPTFTSQTKNYVLAAPSNANGVPSFRALVAADIPNLSWNKITSDKPTTLNGYGITDAVKAVTSTDNAIARFNGTSGQIQNSGVIIDDNNHLIAPSIRIANTYYGISFGRTTGTPVETILHTGIKWVSSTHMPVIHIIGYAYGLNSPVEFKIGFYIYGNKIGYCGATNMGSWEPDIYLFKEARDGTNYVAVGLAGSCYFLQLSVDLQDEMGKFNNVISTGWSWDFLTTAGTIPSVDDGTTCVNVPYKASIFGAKYASITTTSNAIAYYTNTAGTFGSKASANGALYATSTNGALQWGTLPIAQGGTGATSAANARTNLELGTMATETASLYAKLASPALTGTPTAPTAANGTNTTQIATTAFVNNTLAYANAMTFKGTLGTGGTITALPASHNAGDTYRVITAGTWAGKYCEVGTLIICVKDGTATADADWTSVETNEDGAVIGTTPTSSTNNAIARWDGTSGRIIQDSKITIDDNGNLLISHAASATMTADSTNPKITFAENGSQPVHLIYSDYDSYRSPAGLKIISGTSATPAWFEVEGNVYAAGFNGNLNGNATTATTLQNARTIWGQSFDGSGNISGNMTNVGSQIKLSGSLTQVGFYTSGGGAVNITAGRLGLNSNFSNVDLTNYVLDVSGKVRIKLSNTTTNSKEFIITGSNNNYISLHTSGIQAYNSDNNTSLFYLQYYGGDLQIGSSDTATATRVLHGKFDFKSATGFNFSGISAASDNAARYIWFSYNGQKGTPVYDEDFKFNPSTNTLSIGTGTLTATNYSGNAATATNATTATKASYLLTPSITTETDIESGTRAYQGSGSEWTGSISSMQYAGILQVCGGFSRGWQIWAQRGDNTVTNSLHWRNPNNAATAWNTERTILDTGNTTAPSTVPTLAWGTESTVFTLNGTAVKIKAMSSPTWSEVQSKPATATRWPKWNEIGEGSDTLLTQGTSEVTASTEILTSYATNNGFSDSNAPGRVYRRAASKVVNATLVKAALSTGSGTAKFLREDGTWSNVIKQASTAALGIDTDLKIGTAIKDLHFSLGSGSGTDINSGNAGGITFGSNSASYGGIYWQASGNYGSRIHFATTTSFTNGAYTRMIIQSNGNVGIGTLTPSYALSVNGDVSATNFRGTLQGNATGTANNVTGTVAVGHGGTGTTTAPTQGGIIYASSTSAYASTAAGNANQVLVSNGTSAPTWRNDRGIEYIRGMWTAASGTWTGTTQDTALYEGKQIILFMPFAGSGNATLNLTLNGAEVGASGSTTTGAKNVYYESTTRFTTHKGSYSQLHLIYHENLNIGGTNYTGWWYLANRDTNDGQYYLRQYNIEAQSAITNKHIIGGTDNGYNNVDSTAFDIRYAVLYCNSSLSAGKTGSNNYLFHYAVSIQNSANSNISLTAYKNVYIKGTISGNIFTPISGGNPYVQDITAADDGYCYYYIGRAYNTSSLTFDATAKAIYWYKNGNIQPYTPYAASTASVAFSDVTGADDIQAIEALTGTTGFLKKTAANTWTLDTSTYLTSHYTSHLYVNATSGGAASNAATANTTTYIHLYDDSTKRDTIQIKGSGDTTVSATNSKVITISSTNTDTKVNYTLNTTNKAYLLASITEPTSTTTAREAIGDTGVYLTTTAGQLNATSYVVNQQVCLQYNSTDQSLDFIFV